MESQNQKLYLIDHQEKFLFEWCRWEYAQMLEYLSQSPSKVLVTNSKLFENYNEDQKELNEKMLTGLKEDISKSNNKMGFVQDSINELVEKCDKTKGTLEIDGRQIPIDRICLLDMRATESLRPEDGKEFDVFLFGGILGDNPPRDRTSVIRRPELKSRQLGTWQLPTDTAVLITKLVVENGVKMEDIPYIDEPEFVKKSAKGEKESVTLDNFRVVTDEVNYHTGEITKKKKAKPLGNPGIYEKLIFEELDLNMDDFMK